MGSDSPASEVPVLDLVFVGVSILFFAVSVGYVTACDRLMRRGEGDVLI